MKKIFRAKQNNAGGKIIGPNAVYILATTEEAAEQRIKFATQEGILASAGCHCCGHRWEYVEEVDEVKYPRDRGDHETCYLDDELNLLPVHDFTFFVDKKLGATFTRYNEEIE